MLFSNAEKIVDYSTYIKQINAIKIDYVMERQRLKNFSYYDAYTPAIKKSFVEYLKKYKKLMTDVLNKTLRIFSNFLKDYKYMVVLHGSFARNSYREYSDIDVSFVLEKKKTKSYVVFEELFYHALTHILGIGRDRIHSVFNRFTTCDKRKLYDNEVILEWTDNKRICYHVKDTSSYELYLSVNSERSYSVMLNAISNKLSQDVIFPNAYSYDVVFNNTSYNLENDIMAIGFRNRNNFSLPRYEITSVNLKRSCSLRDLKIIIKDLFMNELFEFSSYIRHHLVRRYNLRELLDIDKLLNSDIYAQILGKNQRKLRENYYEYLFYLTRIEICLREIDVELSTHDLTPIDCKKLVEFYQLKFKTKDNIIDRLFRIIADNREIYKITLATI